MYRCPACGREIGLMADAKGQPTLFKCIWTGRVVGPQEVVRRDAPKRRKPNKQRRVQFYDLKEAVQ